MEARNDSTKHVTVGSVNPRMSPVTNRSFHACASILACLLSFATLAQPTGAKTPPPPPLEDDGTTPMVRGAMGHALLPRDEPEVFTFATDGAGLLTLCWTEPGKPYLVKITDPKGERVRLDGSKVHAVKNNPAIRTIIVRLAVPGVYRLELQASKDTKLHLGYAWMPMTKMKDDKPDPIPFELRGKGFKNKNVPSLLVASTRTRDKHHWVTDNPRVPIGHVAEYASPSGIAKRYHHPADGPGVLTLAVRGENKTDMAINYKSHAIKPGIKGHHDQDHYGDPGAEQTELLVPSPDNLLIEVDPLGGGGRYAFSGSWISLEGVIQPEPTPTSP